MDDLKEIFDFAASTIKNSPAIIGCCAVFSLAATTFVEFATTGIPFWSTFGSGALNGAATFFDAGKAFLSIG